MICCNVDAILGPCAAIALEPKKDETDAMLRATFRSQIRKPDGRIFSTKSSPRLHRVAFQCGFSSRALAFSQIWAAMKAGLKIVNTGQSCGVMPQGWGERWQWRCVAAPHGGGWIYRSTLGRFLHMRLNNHEKREGGNPSLEEQGSGSGQSSACCTGRPETEHRERAESRVGMRYMADRWRS